MREATRGSKVLDLVLSQTENDVVSIEASHSLGKSDHRILIWDYVVSTERKENAVKVPDFRKAKFDELRRLIENVNWGVLNSLNADTYLPIYDTYNVSCVESLAGSSSSHCQVDSGKRPRHEVKIAGPRSQVAVRRSSKISVASSACCACVRTVVAMVPF